jgi:hypothetical protein
MSSMMAIGGYVFGYFAVKKIPLEVVYAGKRLCYVLKYLRLAWAWRVAQIQQLRLGLVPGMDACCGWVECGEAIKSPCGGRGFWG